MLTREEIQAIQSAEDLMINLDYTNMGSAGLNIGVEFHTLSKR